MWASNRSCPPALNSEKYGSEPQPTNRSPLASCWMLPWLPAERAGVLVLGQQRVGLRLGSIATTIPRDWGWTFGTAPLSKMLIVPFGSTVASCWKAVAAPQASLTFECLPPIR